MSHGPDAPKAADELELEEIVADLAYRLRQARWGRAEYRMIVRQVKGIRRGSQLGCLRETLILAVAILRSQAAHRQRAHVQSLGMSIRSESRARRGRTRARRRWCR